MTAFPCSVRPMDVLEACAGESRLRVWLDDDLLTRKAPAGWVQVTTLKQCLALLRSGRVVELSLDNDLGDRNWYGEGKGVIDFICEQQEVHGRLLWPPEGLTIHTANVNARDQMARAIMRYAPKHMVVSQSIRAGKPHFSFAPQF